MIGRTGILICILIYLAVSLEYLDVFPQVGQDEPWIAAAPYKLATEGILGSDLFAGYYGVERHNYQHMPLFPLLQGLVFRIAGVGVFQMRLLPVAFGLLLLVTTYLVGRQMENPVTGLLAALLLLGLRLGASYEETGILLLDSARINRYDIAVPVFGLLALWNFNRAEQALRTGNGASRFKTDLMVGFLIGLAGLSHLYGIFWLPALWSIGFYRYGWTYIRHSTPYLMAIGSCIAFLPWILFVASGWEDFLGQMRFVADRIDLFSPYFYIENVIREIDRYRQLDLRGPDQRLYPGRLGAWLAILMTPVALVVLVWQTRNQSTRRSIHAGALAVALIVQSLLFATLLKIKSYDYIIALWPLAVLALAWLGIWLWHQKTNWQVRGTLLVLLGLVLIEGSGRIAHRRVVAAETTPYTQLTAQLAAHIPPGARVLGLQHYWLGLRNHPYNTWLLPLFYAMPEYYAQALAMDVAMERVDPDVILMDHHMQAYFNGIATAGHPNHAIYLGYQRYLDAHHVTLLAVIEDATYGRVAVYRIGERRP